MKISLDQVGKRFISHRIFQAVTLDFEAPHSYALLGANGSGKSTLMRIIAGMQTPSRGKVHYTLAGKLLEADQLFRQIAFCAPGMELIEELSLQEFLKFHFSFKPLYPGLSLADVIGLTGLHAVAGKPISDFSSGMKQRVKLVQAICSDTPVLLLDEPCTNLDQQGMSQYREWISLFTKGRLVIVASNDDREYDFCETQLLMSSYQS